MVPSPLESWGGYEAKPEESLEGTQNLFPADNIVWAKQLLLPRVLELETGGADHALGTSADNTCGPSNIETSELALRRRVQAARASCQGQRASSAQLSLAGLDVDDSYQQTSKYANPKVHTGSQGGARVESNRVLWRVGTVRVLARNDARGVQDVGTYVPPHNLEYQSVQEVHLSTQYLSRTHARTPLAGGEAVYPGPYPGSIDLVQTGKHRVHTDEPVGRGRIPSAFAKEPLLGGRARA